MTSYENIRQRLSDDGEVLTPPLTADLKRQLDELAADTPENQALLAGLHEQAAELLKADVSVSQFETLKSVFMGLEILAILGFVGSLTVFKTENFPLHHGLLIIICMITACLRLALSDLKRANQRRTTSQQKLWDLSQLLEMELEMSQKGGFNYSQFAEQVVVWGDEHHQHVQHETDITAAQRAREAEIQQLRAETLAKHLRK